MRHITVSMTEDVAYCALEALKDTLEWYNKMGCARCAGCQMAFDRLETALKRRRKK